MLRENQGRNAEMELQKCNTYTAKQFPLLANIQRLQFIQNNLQVGQEQIGVVALQTFLGSRAVKKQADVISLAVLNLNAWGQKHNHYSANWQTLITKRKFDQIKSLRSETKTCIVCIVQDFCG